mgnify:CR=1 FL=1
MKPSSDPSWRHERAKTAAAARWSKSKDNVSATAPMRAAFMAQFATPEERSAYFSEMAKRSVAVRRKKATR